MTNKLPNPYHPFSVLLWCIRDIAKKKDPIKDSYSK